MSPPTLDPQRSPPRRINYTLLCARMARMSKPNHTATDKRPECCTDPVIRFKVNLMWKVLVGLVGLMLIGFATALLNSHPFSVHP